AGVGTQIFSGANSYTGGTTVSAGTLLVANATGTSGLGTGAVSVGNNATLGGTGFIDLSGTNALSVAAGGNLMGGNGTASGTLTIANNVSLADDSRIVLTLGASGTHSSIARTDGTWVFDSDQTFSFIDAGAEAGLYTNIITGLAGPDPGVANWTVANS